MPLQEINLRSLIQVLMRRLWILLLLPVIAYTTASIYSRNYITPLYEASSSIWIRGEPTGSISYDQILTARTMALTYSEVGRSLSVLVGAAQELNLPGVTADSLQGQVIISPIKETELMIFAVRDLDPQMAARKTDAVVNAFARAIEESQMVKHIRVVDRARVPSSPFYPRVRQNELMGLGMGLLAAIGLVLLLEFMDTSVRTPEDLQRRLGGTLIGTIPYIDIPGGLSLDSRPGKPSPILITLHDPLANASEAFRVLRTNIQFVGLDKPLKSILITSATPTEGKSITSANLAIAIAQTGAKVCLVDSDLRLPTQSRLFGVRMDVGLTSVLLGMIPLDEALTQPVPGLDLLPSGPIPPNPSELLGSRRMEILLQELEERYDYVILDSPPTLGLADAVTLGAKTNGVLLLVRSNTVSYHNVQRAVAALKSVKANLLGFVLEGVKHMDASYYYNYYYTKGRKKANQKRKQA